MNSWLKVALYAFIGAIIGSFLLGIVSTGSGVNAIGGYNYNQRTLYMNSYNSMHDGTMNQNQMPMHGGMMRGGMMRR